MTHIDDWLDTPPTNEGEVWAKEFLEHARRPAIDKDHQWQAANPLFCTFMGERYRCTGASRLGDIWLTKDFTQSMGYQRREDVASCSDWGKQP